MAQSTAVNLQSEHNKTQCFMIYQQKMANESNHFRVSEDLNGGLTKPSFKLENGW